MCVFMWSVTRGEVISGVVGSQKPQFALFGDTVNTASRMMSTGEVNGIHISAETYAPWTSKGAARVNRGVLAG